MITIADDFEVIVNWTPILFDCLDSFIVRAYYAIHLTLIILSFPFRILSFE